MDSGLSFPFPPEYTRWILIENKTEKSIKIDDYFTNRGNKSEKGSTVDRSNVWFIAGMATLSGHCRKGVKSRVIFSMCIATMLLYKEKQQQHPYDISNNVDSS